ncbi:S8 family serine peptidase [Shewanella surugensis]|uniref:S8 family serine peptidase n=1 Tax=Shewanella surugensis TaxID=212020 RepID=A0ABT0LA03_9GAMM|nr:S8 family serine peptidase [Shewanella surugensis]MCL1124547.1 S8 family serine peptidase [Shewanella surugensis]
MFKTLSPLAIAIAAAIAVSSVPALAKGAPEHEYVKDSLIVVYKDNVTQAERLSAQRLVRGSMQDVNADGVDDRFSRLLNGKLARLALRQGADVKKAIKMISQHPAVKYAEPNYVIKALGAPDDPSFISLWGMHNTGQDGGTADADIDAVEAWDISTGDSNIVIGVIDTGVDYNHEDLQANIWTNPNEIAGNGIDDDGNGVIDDIHGFSAVNNNGDPMDGNGHGTHVSGTIGAKGNNGVGVAGVNWDVTIVGCQFLDASGSGSTEGAIACIDYMTDLKINHGVDIKATNNSWGGGGFSQALKDSIDAAGDAGILFFAAAGNSAVDNDVNPHYPSSYDSEALMSIASTDRNDNMSSFSQWGLTSVDMGAPGSSILSTTPSNGYSTYSGTSMATPHMAGAAGLVWSVNPDLSPVEMKQLLMESGDTNADLIGKTVAGTRLNVANALEMADPDPSFKFSASPMTQTIEAGSSTSYDYTVGSIAGWNGEVSLSVSVSPELAGVSLSTDTVVVGDTFMVNVASDANAAWGDYSITVAGMSGDLAKSKSVSLKVLPQGIEDFTYANDEAMDIPDNDVNGIVSTIEVADDVQMFGVNSNVNISHTWIGDLIVTLTSPAGTQAVLHNREGGSADDIVKDWDLSVFNGEMAMGTWTLSVNDNVGADTGMLNNWGMVISGVGEGGSSVPAASFDYSASGLMVDFMSTSTDADDDIVSYAWSFGDDATSSDMNPSHAYAQAGSYPVELTVTDAEGNTDTTSMSVSVAENEITASITRAKISRRGSALVDLRWEGALGDSVSIYRDGALVTTTSNDGRYRDRFTDAGESAEYQICEADTELCSAVIVATF